MDYISILVLIYFFLFLTYFIADNVRFRNIVLLLISILFYAWGQLLSVFVILLISILNYSSGRAIGLYANTRPNRAKLIFIVTIVSNIAVYILFRYVSTIFIDVSSIFGFLLPVPEYILPIGMLIFTFNSISYIADVYLGKAPVEKNFFYLMLYISLFPQVPVGPIVKYSCIYEQIHNRNNDFEDVIAGFYKGLIGVIKVFLFSYFAGNVASYLLKDNLMEISAAGAWIGILLFSCQIYFWFSGFSDISIGVARIFGLKYEENFNYPYAAKSVSDFWNKWNITLNSFFNEYIARFTSKKIPGSYANIIFTSVLIGLWYGLGFNFILWGLYFACLLMIEKKLLSIDVDISSTKIINNVVTILAVMFGWAIFYFDKFNELGIFLKALFGMQNGINLTVNEAVAIHEIFWLIPILIIACTPLPIKIAKKLLNKSNRYVHAMQSLCFIVITSFVIGFIAIDSFKIETPLDYSVLSTEETELADNTTFNSWLSGTPVLQVKKVMTYYSDNNSVYALIKENGKALLKNDSIVYTAKENSKYDRLEYTEEETGEENHIIEASNQTTGDAIEIGDTQIVEPEVVETEKILVTDSFVFLKDKALELFHYDLDVVNYAAENFNNIMESVPDHINKYLFISPMNISYEEEKYRMYSDDLKTAIDEIYSKTSLDVNTIDAYGYMEQHKSEKLFLNTEDYWTSLGAYYGAQAFSNTSGVEITDISQYEERRFGKYKGSFATLPEGQAIKDQLEDIVYYLHKEMPNNQIVIKTNKDGVELKYDAPTIALSRRDYAIFIGKEVSTSIIEGNPKNGKSLMIVGDSYVRAFAPWLIPCYEKIIYVNVEEFRKGKMSFSQMLNDYAITDFMLLTYGKRISSKAHMKYFEKTCLLEPE